MSRHGILISGRCPIMPGCFHLWQDALLRIPGTGSCAQYSRSPRCQGYRASESLSCPWNFERSNTPRSEHHQPGALSKKPSDPFGCEWLSRSLYFELKRTDWGILEKSSGSAVDPGLYGGYAAKFRASCKYAII